jgi:hypothetical protein
MATGNVSETSTVFDVRPEALVQDSTNGNCSTSIRGVNDLDIWIIGQPFFQGRYVDHSFDDNTISFANLAYL